MSNIPSAGKSEYLSTFTSFSGANIVATFNGLVIGELQAISYSVSREKAPIYTMGDANPRSFSRGKRGIAGSLVFTQFDRDVFYQFKKGGTDVNSISVPNSVRNGGTFYDDNGLDVLSVDEWEDAISTNRSNGRNFTSREAYYTDEILPFDITITMKNEYGQGAKFSLLGVELLNEGMGFSIDDITTEKACTFIARELTPIERDYNE